MKILFVDDYYSDFEGGLKTKFGNDNVICQKTPNFKEIKKAIEKAESPEVDIVLLDIMFDCDAEGNSCRAQDRGGELLKKIKKEYNIPVIILTTTARETNTDYPDADGVKSKPTDASDDKFYKMIFEESSKLFEIYKPDLDKRLGMVIGDNSKMIEIAKSVIRLAESHVPRMVILVTGETGTGKEEICKAIHKEAGYKDDVSYQVVHCGHIEPRDFRIKLGGFPIQPQAQPSKGVLEILERLQWKGTLVIDEVDDLNPESQNILNRILEGAPFQQENNPNRIFSPASSCRFIFTAQRDLQQMVDNGKFRPDLWGRIMANRIQLPPLRERKEIIPLLFTHIVGDLTKNRYFDAFLRDDVKEKLLNYDYPQNIRELRNILIDAITHTSNSPLRPKDIRFPEKSRPLNTFLIPESAAKKIFKKELTYDEVLITYRRKSKEMRKIIELLIDEMGNNNREISQESLSEYLQTNVETVKALLGTQKDKSGKVVMEKISTVRCRRNL